jgi:dipeptidase D
MTSLDNIEPSILWRHFSNICSIPHPSRHLAQITEYIQKVANTLCLKTQIDETGNILISKDASKGKEGSPGVILQGHLDMVPQKNNGINHDFKKDPIIPYIDGSWVKAKNTTLGADNGIGTAVILAVLESKTISHGPIEALFTVDEEIGMIGALGLKPDFLKGKRLLNLDTEEDGQIYIGCAGGVDSSAILAYIEEPTNQDCSAYAVTLKGLKGGHSGIDIHLGRGNAIKLLNRILFSGSSLFDLRLNSFQGGSVRNAIPREATAIIAIPTVYVNSFQAFILEQKRLLRSELYGSEADLKIEIIPTSLPQKVASVQSQSNLLRAVYACPNGVIRMSSRVQDVVETSNNLAIIDCKNGTAELHCLLRSSIGSSLKDLEVAVSSALTLAGAVVEFSGDYPEWEPNPDSRLLKLMIDVYESITGDLPEVKVVHAGLECGIIGSKYPDMEMVSCGPTIQFPHSPDERVEIASVKKFWQYLTKVLEVI